MKIKVALTANELKDVQEAIVDKALDNGILYDEDEDDINALFAVVDEALQVMGVDIVEEEEIEPDDFEIASDPIEELLYDVGGKTVISADDARKLMEVIREVGLERGLTEKQAIKASQDILIKIGEDYGIDYVETDDDDDKDEEKPYISIYIKHGKRTISEKDADKLFAKSIDTVDKMAYFADEKERLDTIEKVFLKVCEHYGITNVDVEGE